MPIPSLDKTWHHSVNNSCPSPSSLNALVHFINSMTSLGPSPWQIMDAITYQATPTPAFVSGYGWTNGTGSSQTVYWGDVSGGGAVNRTWVRLRQPGLGNLELVFDCNGGSGGPTSYQAGDVWCSPSGAFTGGSSSARPTAPDEFQVDDGSWIGGLGANGKSHVMVSSDGQCTYCFHVHSGNLVCSLWMFAKMKNPNPLLAAQTGSDVVTGVVAVANTVSTIAAYANLHDAAAVHVRWNGVRGDAYLATEGYNGNALGQNQTAADSFDSSWPMTAISIVSNTPGTRGRYGMLFDLYWGSTGVAGGDDYDETGNKVFGQLGNLVVPAGGNILQVT